MLPHAPHARQVVLELRQLDLELPLGAHGVLGEDVEDQLRPVDHARVERVLEVALLRRVELVVDEQALGLAVGEALLQLLELALADVGALRRAGAGAGTRGRPARRPRCAPAPRSRPAPCPGPRPGRAPRARSRAPARDRSGSRERGIIGRLCRLRSPRTTSRPGRSRWSTSRRPRAPRRRSTTTSPRTCRSSAPTTTASRCCTRSAAGEPLVLLAGHTDTVPEQGNLPGRIEDGWVHGLGATDMKGGLAVMIELARWAAEAELAYDLGLLFFPREELGPEHNPLPGRVRGGAADRRGGARDLPRADRQHAPARLPRQPQRAARLRGRLGPLGAAVAGRERGEARRRGPARRSSSSSRATP